MAETPDEIKQRKASEQEIREGHVYKRIIAARNDKKPQLRPAHVVYSSLGI